MNKQYLAAQAKQSGKDEILWFSGVDVDRFDWERGLWKLKLPFDVARLDRLKAGAPLVKDHNYNTSVDDVIGTFTDAWIDQDGGKGRIKWGDSPVALEAKQQVDNGVLKFVSMEIVVDDYLNVTPPKSKISTFQATGWEVMAVALVAVPADINAQFLGANGNSPMPQVVSAHDLALAQTRIKLEMARCALEDYR